MAAAAASGGGGLRSVGRTEEGGRGGGWRPGAWRGKGEVPRGEAGGGRGLSGARHASPLFVLLAEEEEDKGEEVGWASQMELGQALVGCTVRPGNLCSFYFFLFVLFNLFCHCFEF